MEHTVEKNHVRAVARAGPVIRTLAGMALALLGCAILGGCDKPTKPKEVKYNIYFAGSWYQGRSGDDYIYSRHLYVYDADSLTLRDSIPISNQVSYLAISPDGRWLYAEYENWGSAPGGLYKIDAVTKQIVWSAPGYRIAAFLDRGRFLMKNTRTDREVIDPIDGHTIRQFTIPVHVMQGPPNGTRVAAVVRDSSAATWDTVVTVLDVKTGEMYGRYVPCLASGQALQIIYAGRLHPDGNRVLIIGAYGNTEYSWFMIGDVATGETLFRYRLYSPYGEIAISEDGALAVASDPGNPEMGSGYQAIEFFDLGTMQHQKTLDYDSGLPLPASSQVRFLPGDRKIAIAPTTSTITGGPFCIIDRATLTVENIVEPPVPFVGALGVGMRP